MTTKARTLARRLANGGRFTTLITKRTGQRRQMRFDIAAHTPITFSGVDGSPMVCVFDLDHHAPRTLRLDAVSQLTQAPAAVEAMVEAQAGIDLMFD